MNTRKLIIYGGVILLAVTAVFAVVGNSGLFQAREANNGLSINVPNPCIEPVGDGVGVAGGAKIADSNNCTGTCPEGAPPTDVPGSVTASGQAADATAEGTRPEITAVAEANKTDIESGTILGILKDGSDQVYDTETQARQTLQEKWSNSIVPRIRIQYYELGWTKVNSRTNTSGTQAKGFFGTQYSRELNKWGPQATGQYTFLRSGSGDITGRAVLGGFTYNGQQLDAGFADLSLTGTWNIVGDTLQGVASYSCEIGDATGATSVNGKWTNVGARVNWPVWIKRGDSAYKVTFQFGINFIERRLTLPFGLNWHF